MNKLMNKVLLNETGHIIIQADTPEELCSEIVGWLLVQATNARIDGYKAKRKATANEKFHKAACYETTANYLKKVTIEPKPKLSKLVRGC